MGIVDVIILVYFLALLAGMLFFLVTSKRHWRPLLILAVLSGCALLIAYPGTYGPGKSLKPGLDLAGGTTLTYDVKIPEGRDATQVIEDTIAVLQKRVDPTGTMNLIWRRVAGNRIEVQMALAPEAITTKREAMVAAREALLVGNLDKSRVEQALGKEGPERADAFDRLAGGNPELRQKLDALAAAAAAMAEAQAPMDAAQEAYDQAQAVVDNPPADTTEEQQAENTRVADELLDELIVLSRRFNQAKSAYNAAYAQVLASNISPAELARVSDLDNDPEKAGKDQDGNPRPTPRAQAIDDLTAQNPDRAQQIQTYFTALAEYEKVKGPLDDPNDLIALLQGSGVLEMRIAAVPNQEPVDWPGYVQQLDEEGPKAGSDRPWKWYEIQDIEVFADRALELLQQFRDAPESFTPWAARNRGLIGSVYGGRYYVLLADTEQLAMTREQEWALASVSRSSDTLGRPAVGFRMNALGAQRLGALTGPNVGRQMAVLLDNKVVTAPTLQSRLTDGGVITGKFSNEEFEYLVRTIRGGAIEGQLGDYPISIKTTGPAIGEENLSSGVTAALTALIIVAVFMAIYYLFAGLVADFALAANMVIILGVMAMIGGTFTLPGIAGIVLTIGMAVDANVLIFERIREELQNKADMKTAVRLGFDKALSTILDANITTLITCLVLGYTATAEIKVGFIGSLSSDTGLSTLRGAEIAIEELNAAGGVMGEQITLVTADTQEDVTEGVKAYEYLAETEEVDFIVSGSIDDVSLGWLPRMQEYRIPTLDTWTSYVGIIDMVVDDPEAMRPYFMNIASDEALATLYINFGKDVLKEKMGWESVVILAEDTAFGGAITGLVTEALAPVAGIEVAEIITYDVNTVDFAPIFAKAEASGADFIYQVSSVNSQVISSQYVKLQVPMAMTVGIRPNQRSSRRTALCFTWVATG